MLNFSQISHTFSVSSLNRCAEWREQSHRFLETAKLCAEYLTSRSPCLSSLSFSPNLKSVFIIWGGLSLDWDMDVSIQWFWGNWLSISKLKTKKGCFKSKRPQETIPPSAEEREMSLWAESFDWIEQIALSSKFSARLFWSKYYNHSK